MDRAGFMDDGHWLCAPNEQVKERAKLVGFYGSWESFSPVKEETGKGLMYIVPLGYIRRLDPFWHFQLAKYHTSDVFDAIKPLVDSPWHLFILVCYGS